MNVYVYIERDKERQIERGPIDLSLLCIIHSIIIYLFNLQKPIKWF